MCFVKKQYFSFLYQNTTYFCTSIFSMSFMKSISLKMEKLEIKKNLPLAKILQKESQVVAASSAEVLKEFESIDNELKEQNNTLL